MGGGLWDRMAAVCRGSSEELGSRPLALKRGQSGKGEPMGEGNSGGQGCDKPGLLGACGCLLYTEGVRR